ncbi:MULTISPECIES: nicotinamide riboside transporter PnuC [Cytobacillus]|uniref:Nicotinamide riboside transporter pnuC n=1 Tax=Cytobacillus oceanisediminis 2691 TaxID=1196031 RepID=A0A160MA92_9BACI|nr:MULTISPECIES: nicotinamide riboside transporter PnuC [Cytobacillus]EFV79668.1 PnuC protein [Bacillus sp. 2_A_57_CT2]MBY0157185.1 nicotinamide mononucleotide transporter [Cytobacillus firmus]AND39650.1 nicotinamide riboside transporter pnuC [Cytobacillus oceanisediminis 2691]MCM3394907.1 nicotinamide riboside transporter PnuC [Cytobacillus oceanisediminis]MCM3527792.1 nicotinamide riboside transporter PnuC [Cytobacillus oceanisediminis]
MGIFKNWTRFEIIWLITFTLVNIYLFFAWSDSLLGLISSISGMLCVVLVAKGKIANYYFGIVQTLTYAYIAYGYGLYGEAMLNALFYFPVQFIGIYLWRQHKTNRDVKGEDVKVNSLTTKGWLYTLVSIVVLTIGYGYFLRYLEGNFVWTDSATNVLSITAQILMLKRFAEQWLLWISVNVLSIILWASALISQGGNDFSMLVMWTAFLFNSIYGYINWRKLYVKQNKEAV